MNALHVQERERTATDEREEKGKVAFAASCLFPCLPTSHSLIHPPSVPTLCVHPHVCLGTIAKGKEGFDSNTYN